jgi:hypothetical protein
MDQNAILISIYIGAGVNIATGLLLVLLGRFWPWVMGKVRRDWRVLAAIVGGEAVREGIVHVALDTFLDNRPSFVAVQDGPSVAMRAVMRYVKRFPDGHTTDFNGPQGPIVPLCSSRGAGYLSDRFASVRGMSVYVTTDAQDPSDWGKTVISLGSSVSNYKTDHIKKLPENPWLANDMNGVFEFKDGTRVALEEEGRDRGIILKIRNPHSSGHTLIICAGLGEWGTSGAAWFLANRWRDLSRRFGSAQFLIVVDVEVGSDQTAREIRSFGVRKLPWWTRILRRPPHRQREPSRLRHGI